jgi:excisionase family DNA binding protein
MRLTMNKKALTSREEEPAPLSEVDDSILSGFPSVGTLEQAASALQLGITTVRKMCREGRLPSFKAGAQWRIPRAWLEEYMREGGSHE